MRISVGNLLPWCASRGPAAPYCTVEMLRGVDPDQSFGIFADYFDHETGLSLSHRAKLHVRAARDGAV